MALSVAACHDKAPKADLISATDTAVAPVLKPSGVDGLWTGVFSSSPADEALKKKAEAFEAAYYKKLDAANGNSEEYEGENENDVIMNPKLIPADVRPAYYMEPLNGYYSLRSANKVSVVIDGIADNGEINGRSVCAGNERILKGKYEKTDDGFSAELKEPGDDKNDGVFSIRFYNTSGKATGSWKSNATGDTKTFMLEKKDFSYDPAAGNIEAFRQAKAGGYLEFKKNPSVDLLTTADVENLTKPELSILRNLIFARHGYTFGNASFRNYFERSEWYVPYKKDIRTDLTDLEKKNADKLKSYEKYASDAYDEFGR